MYHINPKYKLIGHRGTGGLRPENTYDSFRHAAEIGLDWIEFDVQLTSDQKWIIMHDETVDRTTNGHGKVSDFTLDQIGKLQAGLWFDPPYLNQFIPDLHTTLHVAEVLKLNCNVEVKTWDRDSQLNAALMVKFLQKDFMHMRNTIMISSFDTACIIAIRKQLPNLPIGYLIEEFNSNAIKIAQENSFDCISCDVNKISEADVSMATKSNIPILLYTVNDKKIADHWFDQGVCAVFTDRPDLLL